ncbi:unnamed protein product, partial [Vitrella brassicaformis CCMP3155]
MAQMTWILPCIRATSPPTHQYYQSSARTPDLEAACQGKDPVFPYGGRAGILQMVNHNDEIEWEFNTTKFERGRVAIQHHEAIELPNGNILYLLWVVKDYAEAIQA